MIQRTRQDGVCSVVHRLSSCILLPKYVSLPFSTILWYPWILYVRSINQVRTLIILRLLCFYERWLFYLILIPPLFYIYQFITLEVCINKSIVWWGSLETQCWNFFADWKKLRTNRAFILFVSSSIVCACWSTDQATIGDDSSNV